MAAVKTIDEVSVNVRQLYANSSATHQAINPADMLVSGSLTEIPPLGRNLLAIAFIAFIHLIIILLAVADSRQYRPLNIINPAEDASVQVTMVAAPPPELVPPPPTVEAPSVLTNDNALREVEAPPEPSDPPKPLQKQDPKALHQIPHKAEKKKHPALRIHDKQPSTPVAEVKPDNNVVDKIAAPATQPGKSLNQAPQALPNNVAMVGCTVPVPDYPRRARLLHQEGEVLIKLVIGSDGSLKHHEIARSSGNQELDDAAMSAVAGTHCQPYIENGQAISVMTVQPVTFKLTK